MSYPQKINNWINNLESEPVAGKYFEKFDPANGTVLGKIARSDQADVSRAVKLCLEKFESWSQTPVVKRAEILRKSAIIISERIDEIAEIVHQETGKSLKDAKAEANGAVEMGFFVAGEGRRYYGKTTTSGVLNRRAMTVRQPVGVCGLIIAANTPIANVAWKCYPALLCGNSVILKPSENTPLTALWFSKILKESGLPPGIFAVVQGLGNEAGSFIVEDPQIDLISFTGSVPVGKSISQIAGKRLAKICLELGGKNAMVVCDDADLDQAAEAAVLSAFSNAGQRCASGSRIIVMKEVYEKFRENLLKRTESLKVGNSDDDDFGPVISESQLNQMLQGIDEAVKRGAKVITGGLRLDDKLHQGGYYLAPTIIDNAQPDDPISQTELFGPITCLYRSENLEDAIRIANSTEFGLTAAIHSKDINRIEFFSERCRCGVVSINGPTYGGEPHLPFGGLKNSGNGYREAGVEALDVYSDWKTIYTKHDPKAI